MKVTVVAVTDGEEWIVLVPKADVSEIDPSCVHVWEFENRRRTTLTMMRTEATVGEMGLVRDTYNRYIPGEYAIAKSVAYMATHCENWTHKTGDAETGTVVTEPTLKQVTEDIPLEVLRVYFGRSFVGVGDSVLKKLPVGITETGEALTNSE